MQLLQVTHGPRAGDGASGPGRRGCSAPFWVGGSGPKGRAGFGNFSLAVAGRAVDLAITVKLLLQFFNKKPFI